MIIRRDSLEQQAEQFDGWLAHYNDHVNPELLTRLLRKAVPVLDHVSWKVTEVDQGFTETLLPLSSRSTNQHGTHQAALIALSADYTGGIALATLLTGVPFAGIHPCRDDDSASLWLADMSVRFKAPSTGHLVGKCRISEDLKTKIPKRYFSGKKVFVTLPIEFSSNGEIVAEAEMKYFAQPSIQLRPSANNAHLSPIFKTKLKSSARMIAGVRAQRPNHTMIRYDCAHTQLAAAEQGHLLANRLRDALPQLTDMVHARTQHGDDTLRAIPGLQQVVLLGAGLDMRPYRFFKDNEQISWFEIDLPAMLEERQRVVSQLPNPAPVKRRPIALDLTSDELESSLRNHPDFDPMVPTLFIFEGCTMYFGGQENRSILRQCKSLMENPSSRIWFDIVAESVVQGTTTFPEVQAFLDGMDDLGEQFIFGHNDPQSLAASCGLGDSIVTRCSDYLVTDDPVFDLYQFVVAK